MGIGAAGGVDATQERAPAVAGSFYPEAPGQLGRLVDELLADAGRRTAQGAEAAPAGGGATAPGAPVETGAPPDAGGPPGAGMLLGLLVPHAGLVFSGIVAAAGWRLVHPDGDEDPGTIVILGTNHGAIWLDGLGVWDRGAWRTPLGPVAVDEELAAAVVAAGAPFSVDRAAHGGEHSIEVQLPFLRRVAPRARIVPVSAAAGTGAAAIDAGTRLGQLLAARRAAGARIRLAISSDMAHYPPARVATLVTEALIAPIEKLDPRGLAGAEESFRAAGVRSVSCGMCGIEPAVTGLAALRAMGATSGRTLLTATSADAGGETSRTVGYLSVAFRA